MNLPRSPSSHCSVPPPKPPRTAAAFLAARCSSRRRRPRCPSRCCTKGSGRVGFDRIEGSGGSSVELDVEREGEIWRGPNPNEVP
jgi:hypothetical protein